MIFLVILVVVDTIVIIALCGHINNINERLDIMSDTDTVQTDINKRVINILDRIINGDSNADSCNKSDKV